MLPDVPFTRRARNPDGTINRFFIQTIDNRTVGSTKVNSTTETDVQSYTTRGA